MIRIVARIVAAAMAVFIAILTVAIMREDSFSYPVGTSRSFTLNTANSSVPKAELVAGLNHVADSSGATIVKASAGMESDAEQRDLIWFGTRQPTSETEVDWFDRTLSGSLIASSELGDRPLTGHYMMSSEPGAVDELMDWAESAGVGVEWTGLRSLRALAEAYVSGTGAGFAVMGVVVLLVAVAAAWFAGRMRSRLLRLMNGVRPWRIHGRDIWLLGRIVLVWSLLAWALSCAAVAVGYGTTKLSTFAGISLAALAVADALVMLVAGAVSVATRPRAATVANRQPPVLAFTRFSLATRAVAVVLAVAIVPFAFDYAQNARDAHTMAARWAQADSAVTVSLTDAILDLDYEREHFQRLTPFAQAAQAEGIAALSFSLGEFTTLENMESSGFDDVVVTDRRFLELMGIGVGETGSRGELVPSDSDAIPPALRAELEAGFGLWTADGSSQGGYSYFTYSGDEPLPVIGKVLSDGDNVVVRNPLVIVVDEPMSFFDNSMLDAFMINGQMIFTDADKLRQLLAESGMDVDVMSVDGAVEQILTTAQEYEQQARLGMLAAAMALLAIAIAVIQAAQTWAGRNQRRIFALHSAGDSYLRIARRSIAGETVFIVVAATIAAMVAVGALELPPSQTLLVMAVILPLYIAGTACAFRLTAAQSFRRSLHRQT